MYISAELQNHWLWQDKPFAKWQAWIDLNLSAANECIFFRGKCYSLPNNQLITSESELRKRWGWSRTKVRNFLQQLNNVSMIKSKTSQSNTIITIIEKIQKPIKEQDNGQQKKQVETQPKPTDNVAKKEDYKQGKKQVEIQSKNTSENKKNTKIVPRERQLTIMDAIKENNNGESQPTQ